MKTIANTFRGPFFKPLGIALVMLLTYGCPYESPVPLDRPSAEYHDDALLGTWVTTEKRVTGLDSVMVEIKNADAGRYTIEHRVKKLDNPADSLWLRYRYDMHLTKLGGKNVMNVKEQNDSSKYLFFLYDLRDSTLRLSVASDAALRKKQNNSEDMQRYFLQQMHRPHFVEEERILTRFPGKRQ